MVNTASRWSATDYAKHAAFVPALGDAVLQLLNPHPGELILDLGCGDGVLSAAHRRGGRPGDRPRQFGRDGRGGARAGHRRLRRGCRGHGPRTVRPVRRGLFQCGPALDARSGRGRLRRLQGAAGRRPLRRRDGWRGQSRDAPGGVARGADRARLRHAGAGPGLVCRRRGVHAPLPRHRLLRGPCRADPAPDAAAGRRRGLGQDLPRRR